ncbi:hypothetical protein DMJ13_02455 [halophilic archaeon]|nr:hypothetical protein DMJ13_02455 [halophilic archaeon]
MRTRTDPFFVAAGLYLTVGLLAVVGNLTVGLGVLEPVPRLRWVTIHLVTIGGATQALFGALPRLVGGDATGGRTRSHTRWGQWLALNAGYLLVLLGMATGESVVALAGATLVLGALALLLAAVWRLADDAAGAFARYYRVAPGFFVVGILAAFGMLLGVHGPGGYFGSLEAHVHANVWGFLGVVAAATLSQFLLALTGGDRRRPRLREVTFWGLTLGAVGLVAGPWLAVDALTVAGLATYVVGTAALLATVVAAARAGGALRDARVGHVLGAYVWLLVPVPLAPLVLLFPDLVPAAAVERAAIGGLVFGWLLQLAMGFLPAVAGAVGERDGDLPAAVAASSHAPSWAGVASVNLGVLALWATAVPALSNVAGALTTAGFALLAPPWAALLVALWTRLAESDRGGASPPVRTPSRD